jgi:hypothetical protein
VSAGTNDDISLTGNLGASADVGMDAGADLDAGADVAAELCLLGTCASAGGTVDDAVNTGVDTDADLDADVSAEICLGNCGSADAGNGGGDPTTTNITITAGSPSGAGGGPAGNLGDDIDSGDGGPLLEVSPPDMDTTGVPELRGDAPTDLTTQTGDSMPATGFAPVGGESSSVFDWRIAGLLALAVSWVGGYLLIRRLS